MILKPDVDYDAYVIVVRCGEKNPFDNIIGSCAIGPLRGIAEAINKDRERGLKMAGNAVYTCICKWIRDLKAEHDAQQAALQPPPAEGQPNV